MAKRKKEFVVNPLTILDRPVIVKTGDDLLSMDPVEAQYTALMTKALKGDMSAAKSLISDCQKYGLLLRVDERPYLPGTLSVPACWDEDEWHKKLDTHGFPPWRGRHDGLTEEGREKYQFWKKHGRYR